MSIKKRASLLFLLGSIVFLCSPPPLHALVREITTKTQGISCKKETIEGQLTMPPCFFQWRDLKIYVNTSMNATDVMDTEWHEIKLLQKESVEYLNTIYFFEYEDSVVFVTEQSAGLAEGYLISIDCFDTALNKRWGKVLNIADLGVPLVKNGCLYVTGMERIGKYRLADGKPMWEIGWPTQHLYKSFKQPMYLINSVVFGDASSDKQIIVDDETGKIIRQD